eukprot:CAMPEP_0197025322 /NCGR_PEP_ID=MMETSP1384-20130603/5696_1 /TAXON_ID=29189 /ORGANISM="Ammonia sp." /LENGTH=760 /DNA_ID=CAMNT_0042453845 /DNA_START=21 /DNA_END=2303 /DNA_ORIENTATION=+
MAAQPQPTKSKLTSHNDQFIASLQKRFGKENMSQWINIQTTSDEIATHSTNLRKKADTIFMEGKNGHIGYRLGLHKFSVHYDVDSKQNLAASIGFFVAICYSSNEPRPIFLFLNNQLCEGRLCEDIIGDFSAETAEWRLYGPFVVNLNDDEKEQDSVNVRFESSGFFPHITQFTFIPIAVYNIDAKQHVLRNIDFKQLMRKQNDDDVVHQNVDICIVDAMKRRSLHKTKSYQNFISNILLYVDCSKSAADAEKQKGRAKPVRYSENMRFDHAKHIYCEGKNGFIEYEVQIKRADRPSIIKTYDRQFKLTLGIEYTSPESRPLQLLINDTVVLDSICHESIKLSYNAPTSWRIYPIDVHSQRCRILIGQQQDVFEFTLRLQTDGYFPFIKSLMLMEYEPVVEPTDVVSSESTILDEDERKEIQQSQRKRELKLAAKDHDDIGSDSSSFLKLATTFKDFVTPPSDLTSFEPFLSEVRNICFIQSTYFTGPAVTDNAEDFNDDDEESKTGKSDHEYPDVGITLNNELFSPDTNFYHSRNVDGLWICVSKKCEHYQRILDEATFLVKSFIPIEIRRLFLKYKHGRYRPRYVGPMRLIILSHTHNEQAGCIPELRTKETGRNGTAQPFVFSSSDDFNHGFAHYEWFNGRLTAHELVHAVDMVIRQLIDPCFMVQLDAVYNLAKKSGAYPEKVYAMTDRHEYLAEILTVFLNIPSKELYEAGFKNKEDLQVKDKEGYQFLQKWFIEPTHTLPVLDVFKRYNESLTK